MELHFHPGEELPEQMALRFGWNFNRALYRLSSTKKTYILKASMGFGDFPKRLRIVYDEKVHPGMYRLEQ